MAERRQRRAMHVCAVVAVVSTFACTGGSANTRPRPEDIHKIAHVVIIMQENRSFDSYFGTYPGVDGIPMNDGVPTVCNPNTKTKACVAPYHDDRDINTGGPHFAGNSVEQINGGKMDGFVNQARIAAQQCVNAARRPNDPSCPSTQDIDVMGWHDAREIPNYWAYAQNFVLQDKMFAPSSGWSLPTHLYLVSGWSAKCSKPGDPMSCTDANPDLPENPPDQAFVTGTVPATVGPDPDYAWTDLTYLLHKQKVSWGYFITRGKEPACRFGPIACARAPAQGPKTPGIWNPLPWFKTVRDNGEMGNIKDTSEFVDLARKGQLPAVSWVMPDQEHSEHPPAKISDGQAHVTEMINAVMQGPNWDSTAIFLAWDDWGGFYDHVVPPKVDKAGFGLRVPGLMISAYARQGYVDNQVLSFDAYLKFIEDDFLGGERLDPATDGRRDRRPGVRENNPDLGNLLDEFDFTQAPRKPLVLQPRPAPGPPSK